MLAVLALAPFCGAQAPLVAALEQTTLESPKLLESLAQQPSPEPFVRELYRELQQQPNAEAFSGGQGASRIYGNPLLSSVHKEFWGSNHSFAGQLTYLPLCVCDDPTGFSMSDIALKVTDKSHTEATFTLHFEPRTQPDLAQEAQVSNTAFPESDEPTTSQKPVPTPPDRRITLHLVHGEHGWRVDDIGSSEVPSMKFLLRQRHPETPEESAASQAPQKP